MNTTMYEISLYANDGHNTSYIYAEHDADAMMFARELLKFTNGWEVHLYRHEDFDACGLKQWIVNYKRC